MSTGNQGSSDQDSDDSETSDTPTFEGQVIFKGDFESLSDEDE